MLDFRQLHLWLFALKNTPQEDLWTAFRITRTLPYLCLATSVQLQEMKNNDEKTNEKQRNII